jgi:hypothetical protein
MKLADSRFRWLLAFVFAAGLWPATLAQQTAAPPKPVAAQEAPLETWEQFQGPEAEAFLTKARIRTMRALGEGVTFPNKAELDLNGVRRFAVFKTIDTRTQGVTQMSSGKPEVNFQDSWQLEIPAYTIDRIIGLKMVPATVERSHNGKQGSMQWWVQSMMPEAQRRKEKVQPTDQEAWDRVYLKMALFDQLIYNVDRHLNNVLVTRDFDLRLIDHSRSFRSHRELKDPAVLTRFSRSLLDGLQKLEYQDLRKKVGRYLLDNQIKTVLARRDAILALAQDLVAKRGEAAVIYP